MHIMLRCAYSQCNKHFQRRTGTHKYCSRKCRNLDKPLCKVEGCTYLSESKGYCASHRMREKRGIPLNDKSLRRWLKPGEKRINSGGYVQIRCPYTDKRVLEHRFVYEQFIGRKLLPEETVHHIDGDKTNNSLDNLELWNRSHPAGQRVKDKLDHAINIVNLYGELYGVKTVEDPNTQSLA